MAKIAAQTTEDLAVTRLFQGIYGVGPHTAHSWYVRGLRTLADVRNRVGGIELSAAQELGLQYYADLQRRMPRSEAAEIFERIKAAGRPPPPKRLFSTHICIVQPYNSTPSLTLRSWEAFDGMEPITARRTEY